MRPIDADALTEFLKCLLPEKGMWEIEGDTVKNAVCETVAEAIEMVKNMEAIHPEKSQLSQEGTTSDLISKFIDDLEEIFAHIREKHVDDSVCGLCEYDGAYIGQSGDWCNECPGFDRDDCFKLSDKTRKKWTDEIIKALPTVQPERAKGEWINTNPEYKNGFYNNSYYCSECHDYYTTSPYEMNYCPNCGAKMKGERQK